MSNFVSVYEIDLDSYLTSSSAEEAAGYVPSVDRKEDPKEDSPLAANVSGKNKPPIQPASKPRHSSSNSNMSAVPSSSAKEPSLPLPAEAKSPSSVKRSNSLTNIATDVEAEEQSAKSPPEVIWDSERSLVFINFPIMLLHRI